MRKAFRVILLILSGVIVLAGGLIFYVKAALPNVGAPQDLSIQLTPGRITRGEYLANHVAACTDCHSQRDWNIYAGPLKPGTFGAGGEKFGKEIGFPGTLYSSNITPYALGSWTDGELFRAVTTGVNKNGKALFPLMAYHSFGRMDPEDIMSVIAYVRTLPSVKSDIPARQLDFPLSFLVNTFPAAANPEKKPDSNNIMAYGRYLTTMADCVECHSKVNKGSRVKGSEFGGGRTFDFPNGTVATSANITPDKETGIGSWDRSLFIHKFRQYADSSYHPKQIGADDFNTPMPWLAYSRMQEKDLAAIYAYLQTVKPLHNPIKTFSRKP
jgi:mono/diheme cytochrome c family protein